MSSLIQNLPSAFAPDGALHALAAYRQFIIYKLVPRTDGSGKKDKLPIHPKTQRVHDAHDSAIWLSFDEAIRITSELGDGYGVGFVFTANDPHFLIDIDGCLQSDKTWSPLAVQLCQQFAGAAVEVSQSGKGLHIIGAAVDMPAHGCKNAVHGLEMYHTGRFVALTGTGAAGDAAHDLTGHLPALIAEYFPPSTTGAVQPAEWTTAPRPGYAGPGSDDELIALMMRSGSGAGQVLGNKASLQQLWNAEETALALAYPDNYGARPYDASSADAALAFHLAFWTGGNCEQVERLMRRSALVRDKWDTNKTYLREFTITKAVSRCNTIYTARGGSPEERRAAQIAENARIGEEVDEQPIPTVMTLEDMRRDLVYIGDSGGVVHKGTGRVRKKDAAAGEFAASKYKWKDPDSGKEKEAPALKIWIGLLDRVSVDVLAWAPGEPTLCRPPEVINGNTRAFNTWRGLRPLNAPENWQEWAAAFEQHLIYLVPVEEERNRFIQWLAHIVQHPEELPHTSYLMITEQTGIGRNLLGSIMVRVLRGYVAAGISLGPILDNRFNGRLSQKLLAIVDETREGMTDKRYQRGERLKGLITEEHRHIDTKYGLQTVEKNCCRWLMFSNHYDALPFQNNDRRVIVIENPTQRQTPEYYSWLYGLVNHSHFIGSVRRYLEQVDLSDFNAGSHAPMNDAKRRALGSMMSETDRAVMEFKETWPGDIAGRSDIRSFVGLGINETHLTHAIERAGMVNAGKRVGAGWSKDSVVIVKPDRLPIEQVKEASPAALLDQINNAANLFVPQQQESTP